MLAKLAVDQQYRTLVIRGLAWLDTEARRNGREDFAELVAEQRNRVVESAATANQGALQRTFFVMTRQDAFQFYYSDPRSLPGLDYPGPPQPLGFPYHQLAPTLNDKH